MESFEQEYVLGNDYFTRDHLYYGSLGERIVCSAIKTRFKTSDGYTVKHNTFGKQYEYCAGSGSDIKVEDENRTVEVEVKNLKEQPKPYGTDFAVRHIVPRFQFQSSLKVLVITFMSLLTQHAIRILEQSGIKIVEVGRRLDTSFFTDVKLLYQLGTRIYTAITKTVKKRVQPDLTSSSNPLTNYTSSSNNIEHVEHDTPSIDNNLVRELLRLTQWRQSLIEHGIEPDSVT